MLFLKQSHLVTLPCLGSYLDKSSHIQLHSSYLYHLLIQRSFPNLLDKKEKLRGKLRLKQYHNFPWGDENPSPRGAQAQACWELKCPLRGWVSPSQKSFLNPNWLPLLALIQTSKVKEVMSWWVQQNEDDLRVQLGETFPALHLNPQDRTRETLSAFRTPAKEITWGGAPEDFVDRAYTKGKDQDQPTKQTTTKSRSSRDFLNELRQNFWKLSNSRRHKS